MNNGAAVRFEDRLHEQFVRVRKVQTSRRRPEVLDLLAQSEQPVTDSE